MFPPCCGRGAACPHLLLATDRRQWPNGDDLDLRVLQAIPEAFAGVLRNELQQSGWQQRWATLEMYKTLLGSHYTPVHAPVAAASADEVAAAGRMGRARTATTPIGRGPSYPTGEHVPVVYAHDLVSTMHLSRMVPRLVPGHASKDHHPS